MSYSPTVQTDMNINTLILDNDKYQNDIMQLKRNIEDIENKIVLNQRNIWTLCSHEWIKDENACYDDLVKYKCSKCHLWKKRGWYC